MALQDKMDFVIKSIRAAIGNSKYILVLNGLIKRHKNLPVHVKMEDDRLVFYTLSRVEEIYMETALPEMYTDFLAEICTSKLFGYDFKKWSDNWSAQKGYQVRVQPNAALRLLFVETDMYQIVKVTLPKQRSVNINFTPTVDDGKTLSVPELTDLLNKFRVNGFRSLIDLMDNRIYRTVRRQTRDIYKTAGVFFPGMIWSDQFFNPLDDDTQIRESIQDRKLFQYLAKDRSNIPMLGLSVAHLSSQQVSESLGLSERVPFNFNILIKLIAGMVLPANVLPSDFPHKSNPMFRLRVQDEDLEKFVTPKQWLELSPGVQGYYTETTTYNVFLLRNAQFFRRNHFTDMNDLLEVMRHAALV